MKKELKDFLMWLHYNHNKINITDDFDTISSDFIEETSKAGKYCTCKEFESKAVNVIWQDWHCTHCLKLIPELEWKNIKV